MGYDQDNLFNLITTEQYRGAGEVHHVGVEYEQA